MFYRLVKNNMDIFIDIISFFIFLFALFFLAYDDFVVLRKDISTEKIFNLAFLTAFFALFSARFFYVFSHPSQTFFSLLGFLLFPYFPGMSLVGGLTGGAIFLFLYCKLKKLPFERFFDFFSMSFLIAMPFGLLMHIVLNFFNISNYQKILFVFTVLLLAVFSKFILPKTISGKLKDGTLGYIFTCSFPLIIFISRIIENPINFLSILRSNFLLIIIFIISVIFLLRKEVFEKIIFKK